MSGPDQIRDVMAFYDERGWDWTIVVAFLSAKAAGMWPLPPGWYFRRQK